MNEDGQITHEITVDDGCSAPKCTQKAIEDHLGEFASAKNGTFDVYIEFDKPCDEYARESYELFRDKMTDNYANVNIHYPWEEE